MAHDLKKHWPLDLKAFAIFGIAWALFLLTIALFVDGNFVLVDPLQAIIGATLFNFESTRMVILLEAGIFGVIGVGILAERRWSLLFALIYIAQLVISHLAFALTHLSIRFELSHVRQTATQGPILVLVALYLWIRAYDLLAESSAVPAESAPSAERARATVATARESSRSHDRAPVRGNARTGDLVTATTSQD